MPIKRRRFKHDATVPVAGRITSYKGRSQFGFRKEEVPESLKRDQDMESIAGRIMRTEKGTPIETHFFLDRRSRRKGPDERRQAFSKRRKNPTGRRVQEGVSPIGAEGRIKPRRVGQVERRSLSGDRRKGSLDRRSKVREE